MHLYMPWWGDNKALGFPRGYHIELGGGFGMPGYGFLGGIQAFPQSRGGGYGPDLKAEYRRYYGAFVNFAGRGEQVAREDCYCDVDPNAVDKWGIPVLRFHARFSDHEMNSDVRMASARIVHVQFLCALVTNGPASATNTFLASWAWHHPFRTDVLGSSPCGSCPPRG